MFVSFFPAPRWFFGSALLWVAITVAAWYMGADSIGDWFGLGEVPPTKARGRSASEVFWSPPFLWFYIYYTLAVGIFAAVWMWLSPHPWAHWSILGSALILFVTYFQVQVSVAINDWYGPFYDLVQTALAKISTGHAGAILSVASGLRGHRLHRCHRQRTDKVFRQPLYLPVAHRDERLLHGELEQGATDRGSFAARPG